MANLVAHLERTGMITVIYDPSKKEPKECDPPPASDYKFNTIIQCNECGSLWVREETHVGLEPMWVRIRSWNFIRLLRAGRAMK